MLRAQRPYDAARWARSVAAGRSVMAHAPNEARQNDVTCPSPTITFPDRLELHKRASPG